MKLHELQYTEGARKARKRVGRGTSSGNGKTAGREIADQGCICAAAGKFSFRRKSAESSRWKLAEYTAKDYYV